MLRPLLLLLCCSLIPACAAKESVISGEVYIVTNGRDTIKLSGADVFVGPLEEMQKHIKAKVDADLNRDEDYAYYIKGLPKPSLLTTTDAEGKFSIKVKPGLYAIQVAENRQTLQGTESYLWVVAADARENVTVSLNHNNLAGLPGSLMPIAMPQP